MNVRDSWSWYTYFRPSIRPNKESKKTHLHHRNIYQWAASVLTPIAEILLPRKARPESGKKNLKLPTFCLWQSFVSISQSPLKLIRQAQANWTWLDTLQTNKSGNQKVPQTSTTGRDYLSTLALTSWCKKASLRSFVEINKSQIIRSSWNTVYFR